MAFKKKRPTLAQIAEAAGVSVPTVSKVLHQSTQVASATRERVQKLLDMYGYTVAAPPLAVRKKQQRLINLIVPHLENPYEYEILRGVENGLESTPLQLVLTVAHEELHVLQLLKKVSPTMQGVILALDDEQATSFNDLYQHQVPLLLINHLNKTHSAIPAVGVNNWAGGRAATEYLLSLGHRRIALINGPETFAASQDRLAGYCSALTMAGLPLDAELIRQGSFRAEDGYMHACSLLTLPDRPTALFVTNDEGALGVYQAMYDAGFTIPDDMSIIGFDDLPLAAQIAPPLTTVHLPFFEMGKMATTMLLQLLAGEVLDSPHVELPTMLVKRASCAAIPRTTKISPFIESVTPSSSAPKTFKRLER